MGLSLEQKQAMVSEVATKLQGAQSLIVAEYRGLNVERITQLRAKARKSGVWLRVLKNTLARRAVQGTPFEKLSEQDGRAADVRHLAGSGRRRQGALRVREGERARSSSRPAPCRTP